LKGEVVQAKRYTRENKEEIISMETEGKRKWSNYKGVKKKSFL